jgi:hypothetical protein
MLPLMAPLRWLLLALPVSTEVMLETKLLKQGLWSRDGDGEDLDSWELGESCRLGGEEEELRRLEVSETEIFSTASSSDFTAAAAFSPLASFLLFLFLLKFPLSNIFSQFGSRVQ